MPSLMLLPLPLSVAPAMVLPADSPVSATNSPLALPTFAIDRLLVCANDQSLFAVAARNLVKLSVVPDESDRCTARIGVDGSDAFGLSALISAASQVLTVPAK